MTNRYDALGVKQVIRLEWMERAVHLSMSGMGPQEIRSELHEYLAGRKGDGLIGERSKLTCSQAVVVLMNIWGKPNPEIAAFIEDVKLQIQSNGVDPAERKALYWAAISAAYPFWFNVARQVGRLLNLQDQITKQQIVRRLKEQYGDRQTVSRVARYVIRSFVAWNVLKDTEKRGCYERGHVLTIHDQTTVRLLLEGALHALPEGKSSISALSNNPGFFIFVTAQLT
ncbi:MAG: hypothetical protein L3J79_07390, partial [Candidatus Marinimicrobia bacterium]|nr:hypothetical protein [Candidatus Neomarinimicrobiota bacterium]